MHLSWVLELFGKRDLFACFERWAGTLSQHSVEDRGQSLDEVVAGVEQVFGYFFYFRFFKVLHPVQTVMSYSHKEEMFHYVLCREFSNVSPT